MFCGFCGQSIADGFRFCSACGKAVDANATAAPSYQAAAAPAAAPTPAPAPVAAPAPVYIAAAPAVSTPPARRSHAGFWIVVLLLLGAGILWAALSKSTPGTNSTVQPKDTTESLVTQPFTIEPEHYHYIRFVVPDGATNATVSGHFEATGGAGNDIEVFILDNDAFVNWQNNHSVSTYFNSGKVTQGTIQSQLPQPGSYYLVFSNTFSVVSNKAITTTAELRYTK